MLKKLLTLIGAALISVNGVNTDYDNMTPEKQLETVIFLADVYEETIPQIIEIRDEIDKEIAAYYSIDYTQEDDEEEIVEETSDEEFFWQLKPLPR